MKMSEDPRGDVQPKGHEIVEGDEKHPSGKKEKRSGFGRNWARCWLWGVQR
jgi:hypothetical protein